MRRVDESRSNDSGVVRVDWHRGEHVPNGMGDDEATLEVTLKEPLESGKSGSIAFSEEITRLREDWGKTATCLWLAALSYNEGIDCVVFSGPGKKNITRELVIRWLNIYFTHVPELESEDLLSEDETEIEDRSETKGVTEPIDCSCDFEEEDEEAHSQRSWNGATRLSITDEEETHEDAYELPQEIKHEATKLGIQIEDANDLILLALLPPGLIEALKKLKHNVVVSTLPEGWKPVVGSQGNHTILLEVQIGEPVRRLSSFLRKISGKIISPGNEEVEE